MGKIKKAIKGICRRIGKGLYRIRARYEDWRLGRVSVDRKKPSKYEKLGVNDMESTNYDWLDQMFKAYPVDKNGCFVDVGCGEGRAAVYSECGAGCR